MYKIAILYDFIWYNYFYNTIKYEEAKGNVEIVGIGVDTPYALTLDGREIKRVEDILLGEWDYLICAVGDREFGMEGGIRECLECVGVPAERILPISIFGIPCFDFLEYVEMKARRPTIIASHCWGGFTYHELRMRFEAPFINLAVNNSEFLKMVENLEYYMRISPAYAGEEMDVSGTFHFPVGRLDDVRLYFNHYETLRKHARSGRNERRESIGIICLSRCAPVIWQRLSDSICYRMKIRFVLFRLTVNMDRR